MHRLARPVARTGVAPAAISVTGVVLSGLAAVAAASELPGRLIWAALAVGLAGVADGLDGAVAVLQRRNGRPGAIVDAACDRISDLCFALTLWLAGAPALACCGVAVLFVLHEDVRATARSVGLKDDTVITVAERPTRVILVAMFLLAGGTAGGWTADLVDVAAFWPAAGAWCALALGVIGMAQLVRWLRRSLRP